MSRALHAVVVWAALAACGGSDARPADSADGAADLPVVATDSAADTPPEVGPEIAPEPAADTLAPEVDIALGCAARPDACPIAPPECGQTGGIGAPLPGHLIAVDGAAIQLADDGSWDTQRALVDALALEPSVTAVTLGEVLADLNRAGARVASVPDVECFHHGFAWDDGDAEVGYWYPQGITGSADARAQGTVDGREVLLVSWYHKPEVEAVPQDKGVRIAIVDAGDLDAVRYRFALLVEPVMRDGAVDLAPVRVHAGGLAWFGDLLYVPDTSRGFRVFAMDRILRVTTGDNALIGRQPDGFHAHGYRYVIPQIGRYRLCDGGCCARFSYASIDHSTRPPSLVSGEYSAGARTGRVHRWDLDPASGRLVTDLAGVAAPSEVLFAGDTNVQGALSWQGRYFLSESGSVHPLRIGPPGVVLETRGWVYGAEDLHYAPPSDQLWSLSEHPGSRWVFAVERERIVAGCAPR